MHSHGSPNSGAGRPRYDSGVSSALSYSSQESNNASGVRGSVWRQPPVNSFEFPSWVDSLHAQQSTVHPPQVRTPHPNSPPSVESRNHSRTSYILGPSHLSRPYGPGIRDDDPVPMYRSHPIDEMPRGARSSLAPTSPEGSPHRQNPISDQPYGSFTYQANVPALGPDVSTRSSSTSTITGDHQWGPYHVVNPDLASDDEARPWDLYGRLPQENWLPGPIPQARGDSTHCIR